MTTEKRQRNGVPGAVQRPRAEAQYPPPERARAWTRFITVDQVIFEVNNASVTPSVYMSKAVHAAHASLHALLQDPSDDHPPTALNPSAPSTASPIIALRENPHPLPEQVPAEVLEVVLKYCYFHTSRRKAKMNKNEFLCWDEEYVHMGDPRRLCELASAAYYLEIPQLVELTCRAIANIISGKDPDQIRETFQIENDFLQRLLPHSHTGPTGRRGAVSGRAGQRRYATQGTAFQSNSKKHQSYSLADIDGNDNPDSDENAQLRQRSQLSVAEALEWIESTDSTKKTGKKRKKRRNKNKRQNDADMNSTRSPSPEPPPDSMANGLVDSHPEGHVPDGTTPKPSRNEEVKDRSPSAEVVNLISSDEEVVISSENVTAKPLPDRHVVTGAQEGSRRRENGRTKKLRQHRNHASESSDESGPPENKDMTGAAGLDSHSHETPQPRIHVKQEIPHPADARAVGDRIRRESKPENGAEIQPRLTCHHISADDNEQDDHCDHEDDEISPNAPVPTPLQGETVRQGSFAKASADVRAMRMETLGKDESTDSHRVPFRENVSNSFGKRAAKRKEQKPKLTPPYEAGTISEEVLDGDGIEPGDTRSPALSVGAAELDLTNTRSFIHCPEKMNREVEDFKKRLNGDITAPSDMPHAETLAGTAALPQGRPAAVIDASPCQAEAQDADARSSSPSTSSKEWHGKVEEARLAEREIHLKHFAKALEEQVNSQNTQRKEIRDALAQVRLELSQTRSSKRKGDQKVQQAILAEREKNLIHFAGKVLKQINSLNGQREDILDRLALTQMQLSKLRSE